MSKPKHKIEIFIILILFIIIASLFLLIDTDERGDSRYIISHSSLDRTRYGGLVLFRFLEETGYTVSRNFSPLLDLLENPNIDILIFNSPLHAFSTLEEKYLLQWVQEGNTLIYTFPDMSLHPFYTFQSKSFSLFGGSLEIQFLDEAITKEYSYHPIIADFPYNDPLLCKIHTPQFIQSNHPTMEVIIGDEQTPYLIRIEEDKGTILGLATSFLLENQSFLVADNKIVIFDLFYDLAIKGNTQIVFDEYFNSEEKDKPLMAQLLDSNALYLFLFALVFIGIVYWMKMRNLDKLPYRPATRKNSIDEHISAIASLYYKTDSSKMALYHIYDYFNIRIGSKTKSISLWSWNNEHEKEFQQIHKKIKQALSQQGGIKHHLIALSNTMEDFLRRQR